MKKITLGFTAAALLAVSVSAQQGSVTSTATAATDSSVKAAQQSIDLSSATTITGKLQGSLNAEKARVGDEVVLKVTERVKSDGRVVIEKGSKLVGKVTEVKRDAKGSTGSTVGIAFDTLVQKGQSIPVAVNILAVNSVTSAVSTGDPFASSVSGSSRTQASGRTSGGGLLGGAGNTVGGLAGGATSTVGGVVDTTTGVAGNTVGAAAQTTAAATGSLGTNISGLSIGKSANASASNSTTLSKEKGNVKLDSGTQFTVSLTGSSDIGKNN
ncbi:MAG: hypothetical protein KF831_01265 [Acidobacteria bacterium]|nr:hypothetical protein [Acidobacteriota bacterium]